MKNRLSPYLVVGDYRFFDALSRCGVSDQEIDDALEQAIENIPEISSLDDLNPDWN